MNTLFRLDYGIDDCKHFAESGDFICFCRITGMGDQIGASCISILDNLTKW
jgi:hypothetical protein